MSGLHVFSIGDIPVRVSLWYGLLLLFWFQTGGSAASSMLWAAVVTVSILVHEFGHALVARHYRLRPGILLHGLGGLCHHDRAERDRHDVFIIAAGPLAGLALGLLSWLSSVVAADAIATNVWLYQMVKMSIWVNVIWSVVNLLPMWPLDGGQLFRLLMLRLARPKLAEQITHYTALTLLGTAALIGYLNGSTLMVLLALWIGWANIRALMGDGASGPIRSINRQAKELYVKAQAAYQAEDFKEAVRLGHLLRGQNNVPEQITRETWRILGVSAARLGDHRDALTFLSRAPDTQDVIEARIECCYALGLDDQLSAILTSVDFAKIPEPRRLEILGVVQTGQ